MISVIVYKQANYPVKATIIKEVVKKTLTDCGIFSDSEVEVAIVGKNKIAELAFKYLGEEGLEAKEHPVLAFSDSEVERPFIYPPGSKLNLGQIIISYQKAVEEANKTGKLVDQVVKSLAIHGALHLAGIHHD